MQKLEGGGTHEAPKEDRGQDYGIDLPCLPFASTVDPSNGKPLFYRPNFQ
jgi:hypothetical protein